MSERIRGSYDDALYKSTYTSLMYASRVRRAENRTDLGHFENKRLNFRYGDKSKRWARGRDAGRMMKRCD